MLHIFDFRSRFNGWLYTGRLFRCRGEVYFQVFCVGYIEFVDCDGAIGR